MTLQIYVIMLCFQEAKAGLTLSVRPCLVNTVHDYDNRKHLFRLVTARRSAYLFEADSNDTMVDWIRAIKQCSPDDEEVSIFRY